MPSDAPVKMQMPLRSLAGEQIVISVKVTREWRFRFWLGLKLIAIGYRVLGCKVERRDCDFSP